MTVIARGLPELQRSLRRAAIDLRSLPVAEDEVARAVIAQVRPPRDTGRLAKSIRRFPGKGVIVGSDLPYAAPMEARYHYMRTAVARAEPRIVLSYTVAAAAVCDTVRGE